jgi:hypothetical protein
MRVVSKFVAMEVELSIPAGTAGLVAAILPAKTLYGCPGSDLRAFHYCATIWVRERDDQDEKT